MAEAKGEDTKDQGRFLLELYRKAQSLYENDLYEYFLDLAVKLTKSQIGFFHFVGKDEKTIVLTTWNKQALKNCTANYSTHYPIEKAGNWADCVRLKKPIIYNDFAASPNQKGLPEGHVPIKRMLSIPMLEQGKVGNIFGVGNKKTPYSEEDIVQLEVIASELNKILQQRLAESELRESKEKYHSLFANMLNGFVYCQTIFDEEEKPCDFVCLEVNEAFERIMGVKKEALIGKKATELMPELKMAGSQLLDKLGKIAQTGLGEKSELFFKQLGVWLSITVYSPKKGYFAGIFEDVTRRKNVEQSLHESEERLQLKLDSVLCPEIELGEKDLANIIDVPSLQATMDYLYTVTNMGFALIDLKGNVLVGTGWQDICFKFHRTNPQTCKNCKESDLELSSGLEKGQVRFYKCKNNMWDVVTPLFIGDKHVGNVFFGQFFFDDEVPDRKLFETQAEKYGFDKIAYLAAFERIPKYNRIQTETLMQFYSKLSDKISKISHANLKLAKALNTQKELQNKLEKKAIEVEEYASQMEQLAEERTRQLKDAERLSAIGATAGMVGHDIRNPLQAITNHLYLTKKKINSLSDDESKLPLQENIQSIEENLLYINKIVADLQDFARPLNPKKEQIDVEQIIKNALAMVTISDKVEVNLKTSGNLPLLIADSTMIKRILVNLTQNAVQAMPNGGNLTITATNSAGQTEISIQDTGEGIPKEVQAKLFMPLMTTKSTGQGFGLAVVKRMTEAMGGTVTFESEEGKGTKFIVRFTV